MTSLFKLVYPMRYLKKNLLEFDIILENRAKLSVRRVQYYIRMFSTLYAYNLILYT